MSVTTMIIAQDGIVAAADSRLTKLKDNTLISDRINKLFLIHQNRYALCSTGTYALNKKNIPDFIHYFDHSVLEETDDLKTTAKKLLAEMKKDKTASPPIFYLAGYEADQPYMYEIIRDKGATRQNFSMIWGGKHEYIDKLMNNHSIDFGLLFMHDAIELAELVINAEIKMEYFSNKTALCGGPIDILTITKSGGQWYRHK